jgi:hypothetical protein
MEYRLGSSPSSKAVFVGKLEPAELKQSLGQDAVVQCGCSAGLSSDRIFSEAVLQWWDLHAGYFGFRPVQDC